MFGRDKTKKDEYMLNTLLKMFKRKQLNKNHPLQRKAGQWDKEDKSGLVSTIIKQEDIDPIKICEQITSDTEFILWLIDGIQRLTTCQEYKEGLFKISEKIEFPYVYYQEDGKVIEYDLRKKYYHELPEELKDQFDSYSITVVKHLDCSDDEIAYHIARYNNQKSMNTNQKNVLVMPKIAKPIKNISNNHRFFEDNGTYTEKEKNNGIIDRVVSETVMAMFHLDDWKKGKNMSKYLNANATKEEFDSFEFELDRLGAVVDQDTVGKLFNSKNSFLFFTLFHKFVEYDLPDEKFIEFLEAFQSDLYNKPFEEYDNETFKMYDEKRSTKDKKIVVSKIDMLEKLMKDFLGVKKENNTYENDTEIEVETNLAEENENTSGNEITVSLENNNGEIDSNYAILNFIKEDITNDVIESDIKFYDDLVQESIKITSELYKSCQPALIALTSYACVEDKHVEFDEWLRKYVEKDMKFSPSQKVNYTYLKRDFEKYLEREVA